MDFKIILALLAVSLCSVCRGETESSIGFLVYLPAYLESGITTQAFIEANTTDPFTVDLDFIHGNEDRHFSSRTLITGGSGFISIEVPEVDYWYGRVNVTGVVETTKQTFSTSYNSLYIYTNKQQATFIETDKPIYKPGQEVRFRLVTIDSRFKPAVSNISKIQIQSPQGLQLAQWRDVERPQGLVDLSFQLISEPTLGTYIIRANIDDNWIEQAFKVEEYVLPKFEITVSAAGFLMIDADEYSFKVCAKYTHGQPVRGTVSGTVGKQRREYQYNYYPRPQIDLGGEGLEAEKSKLEDAVAYSGDLDQDGCLDVSVSVLGMDFMLYTTRYWQTKLSVQATVIETTTGNELSKTTSVTSLEAQPMNLALESPLVFKPSIPYQGRIRVKNPDDTPSPGTTVTINATIDRGLVHSGEYTTDDEGLIFFEIPFAVKNNSINLQAMAHYEVKETIVEPENEDLNITEIPGRYEIYEPRGYFYLNPAYSGHGRFIQIAPIYESLNAGEPVQVQVYYTSDDGDVASDFNFQVVARSKLVDAGATLLSKSRKRRTMSDHGSQTVCQQQVAEAEEKGEVGAFIPECDSEGMFVPNQCHPSTGHCWCVHQETGMEVQGTRRSPDEPPPECPEEIPFGFSLDRIDLLNQCPEGYQFVEGVKKCERIATPIEETQCQIQAKEAANGGPGAFVPECTSEGKFTQQQCHSSTGHCWCVEEETGLEVPETRSGPTEERVDCSTSGESDEWCPEGVVHCFISPCMFATCAAYPNATCIAEYCGGCRATWYMNDELVNCTETDCQREARVASEGGLLGAHVPSCEEDGTYSAQQCHGSTGHCWCANTDGTEIDNTRTGPGEDTVDCSETDCQREARVASEGGLVGAHVPSCEEDGTYSAQQCHGSTGHCWCAHTNGTEIEDTRTGPGEITADCSVPVLPIEPTIVHFGNEPVIHVDPQELHEATFSIDILASMSPEAQLLVYYTSPEGEVVADSIKIKVNEVFENEVELDFASDEVKPGGETTVTVSAEPGSLCSVGIVDKSVYVLGGDNKMTPKKMFSSFDLSVRKAYQSSGRCRHRFYKRDIIFPYSSVQYADAQQAFSDSGLLTLSNLDIDIAPCYDTPIIAYSQSEDTAGGAIPRLGRGDSKDGEEIRSYFPETWLWTLATISDGPVELPLDVPHSITDWIANGFCTNIEKGVGIAPLVTLRAFQPFFLSMSLPYSIIREEKTPIKVTVFNYLDQCLVVRVTLADSEEFIVSGADVFTVAVPAGEATTVSFKLAASSVGEIPIQVSAESIEDDEFLCGNEALAGPAGTRDAVLRQLKVHPEGEEETISKSDYFCLEEGDEAYTETVTIEIPAQHVPDTPKGEITVTGDLVGKTLSNVEDLIRMPYGCGEQNLLSMVPNIVALEYLDAVDESTPEIEAEAKKFILAGYQRELNYRRDDNSYSAFGNSNPAGSTFLTAFVVRTYAHAKKFVDIDETDLSVTIDWLRSIQEKDGSFRTVGYLAHKAMKGGVNNNITLAAYVVSAFLEAGYTLEDSTVVQAFRYLNSHLGTLEDNYAMSILAYAYALAEMDQFDQVYEKLEESVIKEEGTTHWESNRDQPSYASYYQASTKAQNIEMTAYVLRAILLRKGFPNADIVGSGMARWLVAQRNPRGGFGSTQDTVIGLTALAEFARLGGSSDSDITMTMAFKDGEEIDFAVTAENRYIVQKDSFEEFPAEVVITAEGTGCVLYSVSADYYIKREKKTVDPFSLTIASKVKEEPAQRRRRDVSDSSSSEEEEEAEEPCKATVVISARYNGEDGASNMAIINFRPVSGFTFDKDSLSSLKSSYPFLRRYEINGDVVTFYFDEITSEVIEFSVDLTREFEVEDTKPALITVMDYYENDLRVSEELNFTCGVKLLAPELNLGPDSQPSTTWTTPFSPTGFPSSTPTAEPDYDECEVPEVCGGSEWTCINTPGTYLCLCSDGYQLDETETSCIPTCPVCADSLPDGFDDVICSSDLIQVMKVRVDGTVRPLIDVFTNKNIAERYYYDVVLPDYCTCDVVASGERLIVVANSDQVGPSTGKWDEAITLSGDVIVLPLNNANKKDVLSGILNC